MPRPLSFVRLDIARFGAEISDLNDADLAAWTRSLFRCLALQDQQLHPMGKDLLLESLAFRNSESERKKEYFRRKDAERRGKTRIPAPEQNRTDQIRSKQSKLTIAPSARSPDPIWDTITQLFFPNGLPKNFGAKIGAVVSDLKKFKATPEEIKNRFAEMKKKEWGENAGPEALRNHWPELEAKVKRHVPSF